MTTATNGVTGGYGTVTYSYNQIGNLLNNSQVGRYTYNTSGATSTRPHAVTRVGTNTYSYDANGNLSRGAGRTITWDAENRPTRIVKGGVTTTFVYDGDGGRVKKRVSTTTVYIGQLYVCKGTACARLIYAGAQRVAMVQVGSGSTSYFHADHLGSTSVLTNASGTAEEHNSYEPYGDLHTHTGTSDEVYKYTGQERDASTDLYFYQARYYAQGLGRFVSPDSIVQNPLDPQAFNRYAYARNNPVRYTDPTGHSFHEGLFDWLPCCDWNPPWNPPVEPIDNPVTGVPTFSPAVVHGTPLPPASLFPNPFGPFGMDLLGMNPWIPPASFAFLTSGGGAGDSGNYTSEVFDITISEHGMLSFIVQTTAPVGSPLSVWLERAFLKMDASGNNAKDFRFRTFRSLAATVAQSGNAYFQTSIYGMQPGYLRIIPQHFPLAGYPPVLAAFGACGGFSNPCGFENRYLQRWNYPY